MAVEDYFRFFDEGTELSEEDQEYFSNLFPAIVNEGPRIDAALYECATAARREHTEEAAKRLEAARALKQIYEHHGVRNLGSILQSSEFTEDDYSNAVRSLSTVVYIAVDELGIQDFLRDYQELITAWDMVLPELSDEEERRQMDAWFTRDVSAY